MASSELQSLIRALATNDVEIIVVGALAAVVQGAPVVTADVDIVHRRTPENIARLVDVLHDLDARYRGSYEQVLRPTAEILSGTGHSLLQTRLGPLDVLGAIEGGRDYDALLPHTRVVDLGDHRVRVLGLPMIVEIKRSSSRRKDQLVLPILEETLRRTYYNEWARHPLCAPRETLPERFWGPERLDSAAFVALVDKLDARAEVEAILRALDGMTSVVDVGGGTGFLTQQIATRVERVIVIEPDPEQRARVPATLHALDGRAEALPLADGEVDAALATWVLQYCDDPLRAVDELARVARRRVVIVQAAPGNDLVEVYNREAQIANQPRAHHGFLLVHAASRLAAAGFTVALERIPIPVRVSDPRGMAEVLSRLHFADHPRRMQMVSATEPLIMQRMADRGAIADDGVLLVASKP